MTKERLKELIKQRGIVYHINGIKGLEIKLLSNLVEVCGDNLYAPAGIRWSIKNLYETKEQAEWALKTVAERTERFEPPMWEDIDDYYEFYFRNGINNIDDYFLRVKKNEYIEIVEDEYETIFDVHKNEVTKENYEKACKMVRNLFKEAK